MLYVWLLARVGVGVGMGVGIFTKFAFFRNQVVWRHRQRAACMTATKPCAPATVWHHEWLLYC